MSKMIAEFYRNNVQLHNDAVDALEQMVDHSSFAQILEMLAEIASMKADHIEANWQDEALADEFNYKAAYLLQAAHKMP